jgi:pyruvate/2-oxoglutarate dehydrogenase complex dihydrolipoamide dehydrogenase (E3) component
MAVGLSAGSVVTVIVAGQDVLNPFGASLSERVTRALQDQGARLIVRTFTENNRSITGPTTVNYLSTVVAETTVERSGAAEVAA